MDSDSLVNTWSPKSCSIWQLLFQTGIAAGYLLSGQQQGHDLVLPTVIMWHRHKDRTKLPNPFIQITAVCHLQAGGNPG